MTRTALLLVLVARTASAEAPSRAAVPSFDGDAVLAAGVDPTRLRCNQVVEWGMSLRKDATTSALEVAAALGHPTPDAAALRQVETIIFWRMLRVLIITGNTNNLGAIALKGYTWTDADGTKRPVIVFRSALTPEPEREGSCFRSLLTVGRVRHVVNLYDGDLPAQDLVDAESRAAHAAGASYVSASEGPDGYGPWRETLKKSWDDRVKRDQAMRDVARLVREQLLRPGGKRPQGNMHFHCGGGMHRSGMIAGVLEKCVNGAPLDVIDAHYRYHTGWRSSKDPGGGEEGNLRFIHDFDCSLLALPK
jgi:hypothetical protein